MTWLVWISVGIFGVFALLFFASTLSLPALLKIHLPAQIGLILLLSFFGLKQTQVFQHSDIPPTNTSMSNPKEATLAQVSAIDRPTKEKPAKLRYDRSGLNDARAEIISQQLEAYMRTKRPYLKADLTIEKFAKRMAAPRHHLTQVIS